MNSDESYRLDAGEMKTHTYGSLYAINHAFQEIAEHLKRLEDRQVLRHGFAETQRIAVEESRSGINHAIMDHMIGTEQEDWGHFGRLKIARESADEGT